jgi:hypothetical protein
MACMIPLSQALAQQPEPVLQSIDGWLDKFICNTHPKQNVVGNRHKIDRSLVTQDEFYRKDKVAQVCPFVRDSIDKDQFWVERSRFTRLHTPQISIRLNELIAEFVNTTPAYDPRKTGKAASTDVISKTFLLYFPNFGHKSSDGLLPEIANLHKALKPRYMDAGLALGQFYAGCPVEGIYSKTFRPLFAPVPAFAIRYLALHDEVFNPPGSDLRHAYERFFPSSTSLSYCV